MSFMLGINPVVKPLTSGHTSCHVIGARGGGGVEGRWENVLCVILLTSVLLCRHAVGM